ncbi:MAG: TonB-dependent receptor [Casimicrobiaceae bacterium]
MKFQRKKVATALAYVLGGVGVALLSPYAQAQQADIKVEVTGSNIKRVEGESALPVTVLTREDIQRSGATTAMELMNYITANTSFGNTSLSNVIGASTFSNQTASLRGLGGQRTLILIDGKRITTTGGAVSAAEGVNLSSIPFDAIERVEVLKDGASAIYGSDAIAGVINFIMRSDYRGAEGSVQYGSPTRSGGGEQWIASGTVGFGDLSKDRYNAFMSLSYAKQNSLDDNQRDYSRTSYLPYINLLAISSNTFPGNITTGHIGVPGPCTAPNFKDPAILGSGCYFDPSMMDGVQMVPDNKLWNFFASGKFQINRDWQAYATALYSRDETRFQIQPTPISSLFAAGTFAPNGQILLQPTSAYYPHDLAAAAGVDGQPLDVRYRCVECGMRNTTDTNENGQAIFGVKGAWKNWDWDANGFYSESKATEKVNDGFVFYSRILPLLNSGTVNLFGPNTAATEQQIQATKYVGTTFEGTAKQYGVNLKTSGEIFKLPAGSAALAVGADFRREELDQTPSAALASGDLTGYGGNIGAVNQSRNLWAAYAELNVPIVKTLEGDIAVRYDHYSDFGSTTNPKVSLRWQPTSSFLMRTSYGTGFLAPSLYELYTPNTTGVSATGQSDPLRCPTTGDARDCITQFPITLGGNPHLQPEKSYQFTFGGIWEPVRGGSISLDYFKLNLSNTISSGPSTQSILQDLGRFNGYVTRGPVDPTQPNLPGPITNIQQTYVNQGNVHMEGVDVSLNYRTPTSWVGNFVFNINGTYFIRYDSQNTDGSYGGGVSNAYGANGLGVIPRYKQYASVTWNKGPWSTTLGNTFQTSYIDYGLDYFYNQRRVGSMSLWDLQTSYTGFKNWKLTLGAKNLFDTNPPVSNVQGTFIDGFDSSYYDPRGRFVYGSVNYSFK